MEIFRKWQKMNPMVRFLLSFVAVMVVFYIFYYSFLYEEYLMGPLLNVQARLANVILNILGQGTSVYGDVISSDEFAVSIKGGCDGVEATALFLTAILVFPLAFRWKWPGIAVGLVVLFLLNLARIAGLYLAGIYWPAAFEFLHLHGGVVAFTLVAILLWMLWINWALSRKNTTNA
jgi:exosortase/archaeosortase family protein